jgi:hypothetical protein
MLQLAKEEVLLEAALGKLTPVAFCSCTQMRYFAVQDATVKPSMYHLD